MNYKKLSLRETVANSFYNIYSNICQENRSNLRQIYLLIQGKRYLCHHDSVSLDVNEVCFDKEEYIPNTREKKRKSQSVTWPCRCGKCGIMDTNVKSFSFCNVEALEYFQVLDMRCGHRKSLYNSPAISLNLNTCTNLRTRYRVLESDLKLPHLIALSSLWN